MNLLSSPRTGVILLEIDVEKREVAKREISATGPVDAALQLHRERETWRLDPLSPQIPVVFGLGPFVGGRLYGVHRLIFVFKSPQSGTLHVSALGGAAYKAMRWITKAIGANAVIVNATGCVEVTTTPYPETAWLHPYLHVAFENAAAAASGVETAIKVLSKKGYWDAGDTKVVVIAGDGGTYDIGLQSLSGMLERRHGVLYILYDNEAYM